MPTVLMIAYYFPPLGLAGVQRMAKLARYLPQCGYDVRVLTVKDIAYSAHDETLLKELPEEVKIYRSGSNDPARLIKFLPFLKWPGAKLSGSAKKRGLAWPDSKIGWKNKAVLKGKEILRKESVDIILSSSPPITGHLVARELQKESGLPWVADFRDYWESFPPEVVYDTPELIRKSHELLDQIGSNASAVTSVTKSIGGTVSDNVNVIPGGFDSADFTDIKAEPNANKFIMAYLGSTGILHPIEPFFRAAARLIERNQEFRDRLEIRIIGANDRNILFDEAKKYDLTDKLNLMGYLPHAEALQKAAEASVLMVSLPNDYEGLLPGKVFDCLALPGTILASVPSGGETVQYLSQFKGGLCAAPDDNDGLTAALEKLFVQFQAGQRWQKTNLEEATRLNVARQFAEIFNGLLQK